MKNIVIRDYRPDDKERWLRLRVISFLHTSYYDDVYDDRLERKGRLVDLVAECDGELVGLLEAEIEENPDTLFEHPAGACGMIWNIAVHPDHRGWGIGKMMLDELEKRVPSLGVSYIEAWTRDDPEVLAWYARQGFEIKYKYLHVYLEDDEHKGRIKSKVGGLTPVKSFCHFSGLDKEGLRKKHPLKRIHTCHGLVKELTGGRL